MNGTSSKRRRICNDSSVDPIDEPKQDGIRKNAKNPLCNQPYFGIFCMYFNSFEIICGIGLLTKWNYNFFKSQQSNIIINQIICREFGYDFDTFTEIIEAKMNID